MQRNSQDDGGVVKMDKSIALSELQNLYEMKCPDMRKGTVQTLFNINKSTMKSGVDYVTGVGRNNYKLTLSGYASLLNSLPVDMGVIRKVSEELLGGEAVSLKDAYEKARVFLDELAISAGVDIEKNSVLKNTQKKHTETLPNVDKNSAVSSFTRKPYACTPMPKNSVKETEDVKEENPLPVAPHKKESYSAVSPVCNNSWDNEANEWTKNNSKSLREALALAHPELKKKDIVVEASLINKKILLKMRDVYGFVLDDARRSCKENHNLDSWPSVQAAIYDDEVWRSIFQSLLEDVVCKLNKEAK